MDGELVKIILSFFLEKLRGSSPHEHDWSIRVGPLIMRRAPKRRLSEKDWVGLSHGGKA